MQHNWCESRWSVTRYAAKREGWPHEIELISDEMELPYHRPPLSKDLLLGKKTLDQIRLRPEKMFEDNDISLSLAGDFYRELKQSISRKRS